MTHRRCRHLWLLLAPAILPAGCAEPATGDFAVPPRSAVLFFADGMDAGVLQALLDADELPNIDRRFVGGGVTVRRAVVSMPPITYANSVSLITGRFPGRHGVLGNRWFDRYTVEYRDYGSADTYRRVNDDFTSPTIYDVLRDRFTVSVQNHTRRGVTHSFDHVLPAGIDWGLGRYSRVDRRAGETIGEIVELARETGRWPTLLTFYFPGLDEVGHQEGPDSSAYRSAMGVVDTAVGHVFDTIERLDLLDRTYFALVTDHGHVATVRGRHASIESWLRDRAGFRIFDRATRGSALPGRLRELNGDDAVVVNSAHRRVAVHLRGDGGWHERPTGPVVTRAIHPYGIDADAPALYHLDGVVLVAVRAGDDLVRLLSRHGEGSVERRRDDASTAYRYVVTSGNDPLGYLSDTATAVFVEAGWHESREWLVATTNTRFPDLVPQMVEMFDSPRAGDLVVFADEGWSFHPDDRGGHGSCLAADMIATYFYAGPDLPAGGSIDTMRLVDVMPTLLDLIGEAHRLADYDELDGMSIADELRSATVTTR